MTRRSRAGQPAATPDAAPDKNSVSRVSLADVAEYARVSTATVSRVLNDPLSVRDEKRQAVERACEELGYVMNRAARTLSSKRSNAIGAVVPTIQTQTFAHSLAAFQKRLHIAGYTMLLASSDFDPAVELDAVTTLLGHGVDALMVVGHTHDPKMWKRIESHGVPCLQLLTLDSQHPSIGYDNVATGHMIADHFLQLGHQDIGVIVGTPPTNDRVSDRISGLRKRLRASGLKLEKRRIVDDAFSLGEAQQAAMIMLGKPMDRPTAMVCGNDQLAFGVLLAAASLGLKVPEDLSVIGFNNYDFAAHLKPALTTVSVDLFQLGEQAAEYLLNQLATHRKEVTLPRIETALIVRSSTGPAPRPRKRKAAPSGSRSTP